MPNYCDNYAKFIGAPDEIRRVVETKFNFNNIVPEPKWDNPDGDEGYDWRLENWGCKWNIDANDIVINRTSDSEVSIQMLTPWAPPIEIYDRLVERGLDVEALYFESGMNVWGCYFKGNAWDLDINQYVLKYGSVSNFASRHPLGREFEKHFGVTNCYSNFYSEIDGEDQTDSQSASCSTDNIRM